ncbi:MAG: DsrE/DsrF/TusD sulfur relay family protein [Solirubrobacterales bacterium]
MKVLVIVNDQPYGSERPYNALRLATALSKREGVELRVFLFGDAVACAVDGHQLPEGHYHLDRMLKGLLHRTEVACCGTCMDARGIGEAALVEGARRSTLEELTDWVLWAERTLTF